MNYAALGAFAGAGQGIQQGVGTIVARRKEELAARRQDERDQREQRRLDLEQKRIDDANRRALMSEDMDFIIKGGRIVRNNGTEQIGHQPGVSTASTQPSEYDVDYEDVGNYNGATYQLPKDRLTPVERMKERARRQRPVSLGNLPYYKPPQSVLDLADDPEQGDNITQKILDENNFRDPAHIRAAATSAGAIAGARYPYSATANKTGKGTGADGETPAQHKAGLRSLATQERSNETQARQDIHTAKPLPKKEYGWDEGFTNTDDSLRYEHDNREQFRMRQHARLEAAQHGFSADSATREINLPRHPAEAITAKFDAIKSAYEEAKHEAKTPEELAEARQLFQAAIDKAASEYESVGGKLKHRSAGGGGSNF